MACMSVRIIYSRRLCNNIIHKNIFKRRYQSIIQQDGPPTARLYQLRLLQSPIGISKSKSIFASLSKVTIINRFNLWSLRHPVTLAAIISTLKASTCDYMAQSWIEGKDLKSFNWNRMLLFTLFGFFYCGFVQYGIYSKLYPFLFGNIKSLSLRTWTTTMADMTAHSTFFYFPIFYIFKGMVYEKSMSLDVMKDSLHQYFYVNFREDMIALYKVWLPTMLFLFSVVPTHYRVPFLATAGTAWNIILSLTRGEKQDISDQNEENVIQSVDKCVEIPLSITPLGFDNEKQIL